jgi:hypothetical protein
MCAAASQSILKATPKILGEGALRSSNSSPASESPLDRLASAAGSTLYRTKVHAIGELLVTAGVVAKDAGNLERIEKVFAAYREIRRLQRRNHGADLQGVLLARFELGRQFQTPEEHASERGSLIMAFSMSAYVEQVLSAQSVRQMRLATDQARCFIGEMKGS